MRVLAYCLLCVTAAAYAACVGAAEIPQPVRDTAYDWRCVDDQGVSLGNRQRQDLAIYDCIKAATENAGRTYFVEAGRYRVRVDATTPEPTTVPAALNWTAPTQNTDGTPLTTGTGYRLYVRTEGGTYDAPIEIAGWSTLSHTLDFPADGQRRYFALTALANGEESAKTGEVSKVMQ